MAVQTGEEAGGTPYFGSNEVRDFVPNVPMAVKHTEDMLVSLSCKILGWAHGTTEGIHGITQKRSERRSRGRGCDTCSRQQAGAIH